MGHHNPPPMVANAICRSEVQLMFEILCVLFMIAGTIALYVMR